MVTLNSIRRAARIVSVPRAPLPTPPRKIAIYALAGAFLFIGLGIEHAWAQAESSGWSFNIFTSPEFKDFLSTFGLGVLLVIYFVFIRDPKQAKYWQGRYDTLLENYQLLSENYQKLTVDLEQVWTKHSNILEVKYKDLAEAYNRLESDLKPESRVMSKEQARELCHLGLDRDLYKLYYHVQRKINGREDRDVEIFMQDTILNTNNTWSKFKTPFPLAQNITELFGVYRNSGAHMAEELRELLLKDENDEDKIIEGWNKLLRNTVRMKKEFDENLKKLDSRRAELVTPYEELEPNGSSSEQVDGSSSEQVEGSTGRSG